MRNDFEPVHLKQANAKLDRHVLSSERYHKQIDIHKDENVQISLWQKFLGFFQRNPFELPEELYKHK